jgi:uncharacterized protein YdeI (YjbR/CyaY-like superfamily)
VAAPPKSADAFFAADAPFMVELRTLRALLLAAGFEESIKWGRPSYAFAGQTLIGLAAFKQHFGLWFHQGALLADEAGVLSNAQEGKTQAMRHWRMTTSHDIKPALIRAYIAETRKYAEAGARVARKPAAQVETPLELAEALSKNRRAKAAFEKLSDSCKREYSLHVADAKQATTKQRRIEKILPIIVDGVGLHDKYRR